MAWESDLISAVVCTRNRGDRIASTIETILASEHARFELIVIDQSDVDDTQAAVQRYRDPRITYVRSTERGLGRARNDGLRVANGEIVVYTDDDVTVPSNWLGVMAEVFDRHPQVAVAFCNVAAAEHDSATGFVPTYVRGGSTEVRSLLGKCRARGIGAGLAVRRSAILALGGFDDMLGAGGPFSSCEDGDIAVRAILRGWRVYETDGATVVHDGFRTWDEGRELTRRDWYGIGAAYSKPIKAGRLSGIVVVLYEGVWRAVVQPLLSTITQRRPTGLKRAWHFWRGFVAGLRTPIDRRTLNFVER